MAGYIGSKSSVTLVDGYTEAEADAEFVNDPNGAITVSGSNVGIGTSSPSATLTASQSSNNIFALERTGISGSSGQFGINIESNSQTTVSYDDGAQLVFGTASSPSTHVGFTERMRLDASGRVTMPYQPSFHFAKSDGSGGSFSTQHATILWNYNRGNVGGHYSTSTGRFTAPVAGVYFFCAATIGMQQNTCRLLIRKNGGSYSDMRNGENPPVGAMSYYEGLTAIAVMPMSAGDYASVTLDEGSMYAGNSTHSYFCGYLIG